MQSIYEKMEEDWDTYCLMAGIALIEEMKKPTKTFKTVYYKGKMTKYIGYYAIRLKMVDGDSVQKWFDITKSWENKLGFDLLGPSFTEPKQEPYSGQYKIYFTVKWLYEIIKSVKGLPCKYTNEICFERLANWKLTSGRKLVDTTELKEWRASKSQYSRLFEDKYLAAAAFIVTFDLEARGTTTGKIDLCMSEKYRDFLEYMRKVAEKYDWTPDKSLKNVSVEYSRNIGIKASPQFSFYISIRKLPEIYEMAGPVVDLFKDKCIKLHISRLKKNRKNGRPGESRKLILETMNKLNESTTTELQFYVDVRTDVISGHLRTLEREGLVERTRQGKKDIWRYVNGNERNT